MLSAHAERLLLRAMEETHATAAAVTHMDPRGRVSRTSVVGDLRPAYDAAGLGTALASTGVTVRGPHWVLVSLGGFAGSWWGVELENSGNDALDLSRIAWVKHFLEATLFWHLEPLQREVRRWSGPPALLLLLEGLWPAPPAAHEPVSRPIVASSDAGALFELLAQVGGRMPREIEL